MTSLLRRREELILGNSILVSAIHIDPMSRSLLTQDQKKQGKDTLFKIAIRLDGLHNQEENTDKESCTNLPSFQLSSSSGDEDDFIKHLNKLDKSLVKHQKLVMESNVDTKFAEFKRQFCN